jgi:hypothetical protein
MMGGHKHGQAVIVRQASDPVDSGPSLSVQKVNSLQIGFRAVQNTPECELDIDCFSPFPLNDGFVPTSSGPQESCHGNMAESCVNDFCGRSRP